MPHTPTILRFLLLCVVHVHSAKKFCEVYKQRRFACLLLLRWSSQAKCQVKYWLDGWLFLLLLVDLGAPRRPLLSASTSLRAFAARNAKKRKERKKGTKKLKITRKKIGLFFCGCACAFFLFFWF